MQSNFQNNLVATTNEHQVLQNEIINKERDFSEELSEKSKERCSTLPGRRGPYLGGFRNKNTQRIYLNASTQTNLAAELRAANHPKFHRDTQTYYVRNRQVQSVTTQGTQMSRRDLFVDEKNDKIVRPFRHRPCYETAEMWETTREQSAVKIQCFFRRLKAMWRVRLLRVIRETALVTEVEKANRRNRYLEEQKIKAIDAKLHPRSAKDFEALFHSLEQWVSRETSRINDEYGKQANWTQEEIRLAKLADLVDQETALIQKIDRLKLAANKSNHEAYNRSLLEKMSCSKSWQTKDKKLIITLDTPSIIRARELKELYFALSRHSNCTVDERLQVLLHVKYTVNEYDCRLSKEVVELIDREGDLLSRGRGSASLSGLRQRIGNLFLQFVRDPLYNPEAVKFTSNLVSKLPDYEANEDKSIESEKSLPITEKQINRKKNKQLSTRYYECNACGRYLPSAHFHLHTSLLQLEKCKRCMINENFANKRDQEIGTRKLVDWTCAEERRKIQVLHRLFDRYSVTLSGLREDSEAAAKLEDGLIEQPKRSFLQQIHDIFSVALGAYGVSGDALNHLRDVKDLKEISNRLLQHTIETGSTAFTTLMVDHDFRYLIDVLWKNQSALVIGANQVFYPTVSNGQTLQSEGDLSKNDLVFTRWDPLIPLSPWNCILLTKAEAAAHDRHCLATAIQHIVQEAKREAAYHSNHANANRALKNFSACDALYGSQFIQAVNAKHLAAKKHFSQFKSMEKIFLEKALSREIHKSAAA